MKIGWIGFGEKGIDLVNSLIFFGHEVFGYNRTFSKMCPAIENGLIPCNTIEELVGKVDLIITLVTDADAVYEVYCGKNGVLPSSNNLNKKITCIDLTTSSPKLAKFLANNDMDIEFLDAPFILEKDSKDEHEFYTYVIGGKRHVYDKYKNLFNCLGSKTYYVGESGSGQVVKKANQLAVNAAVLGMSEAIEYANSKRIDLNKLYDSVSSGAGNSNTLFESFKDSVNGKYNLDYSIQQSKNDIETILKENQKLSLYMSKIIYGILKQMPNKDNSVLSMIDFYRGWKNESK